MAGTSKEIFRALTQLTSAIIVNEGTDLEHGPVARVKRMELITNIANDYLIHIMSKSAKFSPRIKK